MSLMTLAKLRSSALAMGFLLAFTQGAQALESDEIDISKVQPQISHRSKSRQRDESGRTKIAKHAPKGMLGIDTIPFWTVVTPNWDGVYYPGDPLFWTTTLVGKSPFKANSRGDSENNDQKTAVINAPIIPINVELLDYDGSVRIYNGQRLVMNGEKHVPDAVKSPIFSPATFDASEPPTQYADAILRANYAGSAGEEWHTLLKADPKPAMTLKLPRGTYRFAVYSDGTLARVYVDSMVLNSLIYPMGDVLGDTSNIVGAAETYGYMEPSEITTFLMPGVISCTNLVPISDCASGWHLADTERGDLHNGFKTRIYVLNFSNWFEAGGQANSYILSHEIAEIFNDPFITSVVPWWQSPDGQVCENWVEVGDVIEMTDPGFQAHTNSGKVYNVANVALLPWFLRGDGDFIGPSPSYSFPDRSLLTAPSALTKQYCAP
jgi:hypothetical protein